MRTALSSVVRVFVGSVAAVASMAGAARADVAPPDGQKYAQYSFLVDNMAGFPDWVLVAYPCNDSDGRPYNAGTTITSDAIVPVGRRGGTCTLYAMKKEQFTTWRVANPAPVGLEDDPALGTLLSSEQVLKCSGGPQPRFQVASSAPDTIQDTVHVQTLTDSSCQLTVEEQADPTTSGCSMKPTAATGWRETTWAACLAALAMIACRRRTRRG